MRPVKNPKIVHANSTLNLTGQKGFGEVDPSKVKEASKSSVLLALEEVEYKPFPKNTSEEVAQELRYIKQAQESCGTMMGAEEYVKFDAIAIEAMNSGE